MSKNDKKSFLVKVMKGIKNLKKAIAYTFALINNKFKFTEAARASGRGERLIIRGDLCSAENSNDFTTLAHIQRYKWVEPYHLKELTKTEFKSLLQNYFMDIQVFGQDILINGIRQRENWFKYLSSLSDQNLAITKKDSDFTFGLIAICQSPKRYKSKLSRVENR